MSERPLRVLFTGCPAYGHLLPMLPMMRAATRAGHDVRVATGRDMVDALRRRGLSAYAVGPTLAEMFETRAAMPSLEGSSEEELILASARGLFGIPARRRVADLTALATEWRPDLVIHDPLELAGTDPGAAVRRAERDARLRADVPRVRRVRPRGRRGRRRP